MAFSPTIQVRDHMGKVSGFGFSLDGYCDFLGSEIADKDLSLSLSLSFK